MFGPAAVGAFVYLYAYNASVRPFGDIERVQNEPPGSGYSSDSKRVTCRVFILKRTSRKSGSAFAFLVSLGFATTRYKSSPALSHAGARYMPFTSSPVIL